MPPPVEPSLASLDDQKNAWKPGPALPEGWQERLVEYLEAKGTYAKACRAAGVSDETVRKYRHADPAFDERCRWAREIHADSLEEKLEEEATATGNPVGHIVRLKAIRPHLYVEKHAVMNFNVTTELDSADGAETLRTMFGAMRPSTSLLIGVEQGRESGSAPAALAPAPDGSATP